MPNWMDYSKYLKSPPLGGKELSATIKSVEVEETFVNGRKTLTPILYFNEIKPGLPLSQSNQTALAEMFGPDMLAGRGKPVILKTVPVQAFGRETRPIRLFPAPAKSKT